MGTRKKTGWIDGLLQRLDDDRYAVRLTPRRPDSNWSELNKWRVGQMIAAGKMTEAGLATVSFPLDEIPAENPARRRNTKVEVPAFIEDALRADSAARDAFNRLAPSHRRTYIGWITSAKREETRQRRIEEMLSLLREGKSLQDRG